MVPVLLAIAGLVIWLFGARVLRAVMATLGLMLGGTLGWGLGVEMHDIAPVPPWAMMLITGLTLACAAALAHRLLITGALMLVFGLAGPLAVWSTADMTRPEFDVSWPGTEEGTSDPVTEIERPPPPPPDELDLWLDGYASDDDAAEPAPEADEAPADTEAEDGPAWLRPMRRAAQSIGLTDEVMRQRAADARSFTGKLIAWASDAWSQTPQRMRTNLVGTAVIGLLVGLLLGTIAPRFSASLVTSAGGGLLWLTSGLAIVDGVGLSDASWMPASPLVWTTGWAVVAVIGLWIQWINRPRKADKSP
jgi:hypothetical protein